MLSPLNALLIAALLPAALDAGVAEPVPFRTPEAVELELWPAGVPGAPEAPPDEVVRDREGGGDRHVSRVHVPTITAYLPAEGAEPCWPWTRRAMTWPAGSRSAASWAWS